MELLLLSPPSPDHAYCPTSSLHSHCKRPGGDSLPSPQLHLLLLPVGGLLPQSGGIWVPVCLSGGLLVIPFPTPLLPTQARKFLLGLKNDLPTNVLDKRWPAAPYKYFNTANHELQKLFYQWKVSGAWAASPGARATPLSFVFFFFFSPPPDFPLLPPSST